MYDQVIKYDCSWLALIWFNGETKIFGLFIFVGSIFIYIEKSYIKCACCIAQHPRRTLSFSINWYFLEVSSTITNPIYIFSLKLYRFKHLWSLNIFLFQGLVNKYHDASAEQMQALLAIRGDFSPSEAKEVSYHYFKMVLLSGSNWLHVVLFDWFILYQPDGWFGCMVKFSFCFISFFSSNFDVVSGSEGLAPRWRRGRRRNEAICRRHIYATYRILERILRMKVCACFDLSKFVLRFWSLLKHLIDNVL